MPRSSRKTIFFTLLTALLLLACSWIFSQRVQRVAMESYVPESALGYFEVRDLPQLLDNFTSTTAWQKLAPVYGLPDKLSYLGKAGAFARWTGIGPVESVVLSRAQVAAVITGIEVRGEEVRPRLAIIAETHTGENRLRAVIEERLPQLAGRAYGQPIREATEYLGVPVMVFRAPQGERRLLSAQIGGEWIVANHPDSMRACIETRLGRSPSMANSNFYLKAARPMVEGTTSNGSDLFAFVSGQGVVRLMQFASNLVAGKVTSATPFTGALEGLLADISARTVDAAAYSASFEKGVVVSRYALLFKPALAEKLNASIRTGANDKEGLEPRALKLAPATVRDVTVINVENPITALDNLELAISSQLGTGQSFILHRVFIGAREALLGLKPNENPAPAFGNEIATISFSDALADRVLLIAARDRRLLQHFAEKFLTGGGAAIQREKYRNIELIVSSNRQRGAAAFVGEFLALGETEQLKHLIESQQPGQSLTASPQFASAQHTAHSVPVVSYSSVKAEIAEMMTALVRRVNGKAEPHSADPQSALAALPFASSTTSLNAQGLFIESAAPFGNFPLLISLLDDSAGN